MRDAYGARIALIAGFSYPDGVDRSVFLFDIDACGFVEIAHAGVFDDVPQAATAWRALVGDTADSAQPERVETAERLLCLVHCDSSLLLLAVYSDDVESIVYVLLLPINTPSKELISLTATILR